MDTHKCRYCEFYATDPLTGDVDESKVFKGSWRAVVIHAQQHPLGAPEDYPVPL